MNLSDSISCHTMEFLETAEEKDKPKPDGMAIGLCNLLCMQLFKQFYSNCARRNKVQSHAEMTKRSALADMLKNILNVPLCYRGKFAR